MLGVVLVLWLTHPPGGALQRSFDAAMWKVCAVPTLPLSSAAVTSNVAQVDRKRAAARRDAEIVRMSSSSACAPSLGFVVERIRNIRHLTTERLAAGKQPAILDGCWSW